MKVRLSRSVHLLRSFPLVPSILHFLTNSAVIPRSDFNSASAAWRISLFFFCQVLFNVCDEPSVSLRDQPPAKFMIIVYEADDLANFDGLEIFCQDELSEQLFPVQVIIARLEFQRYSQTTSLRFTLPLRFALAKTESLLTKRNSFSIIIFKSRKKEEWMDYYP